MRILLAEDDHHVSVIIQVCLERIGGHTVTLCEDGESALRTALMPNQFDLILLDGMMPKKHGLQVARELRAVGHTGPIIFLSAKSEERDIRDFLALGQGFIAKPFEPTTICARIDEILRRSPGAATG
jgi:two-component system OmpR family response regulator